VNSPPAVWGKAAQGKHHGGDCDATGFEARALRSTKMLLDQLVEKPAEPAVDLHFLCLFQLILGLLHLTAT
jgi:hypothetical protein